jgi:hypothetical protein
VAAPAPPDERVRLARDSFTYLHFPMLAGIVYLALGMKKVLTYVADAEHQDLGDALPWVPLVALFGGAVLYLVALSALRRRNIGGWNVQRLVASAARVYVGNTELFRRLARTLGRTEAYLFESDESMLRTALGSGHPWLDGITWCSIS